MDSSYYQIVDQRFALFYEKFYEKKNFLLDWGGNGGYRRCYGCL
jgi:hypothetical protein